MKWYSTLLLLLLFCVNPGKAQMKAIADESLTPKQLRIVPIAAFTANGDLVSLKTALKDGLHAGLNINEIKEILVHVYAYAGFPRSLNAINTFKDVLDGRAKQGIADVIGKQATVQAFPDGKFVYGKAVQTKLTGSTSTGAAQAFVPVIDTFLKEHLFADIFSRNILDYPSREIATISALASLKNLEAQLRSHLNVGRNVGLTETQLQQIAEELSRTVDHHTGAAVFGQINSTAINKGKQESAKLQSVRSTFPKGNQVVNDNFSGDVWVNMFPGLEAAENTSLGSVTFAPKARSNWHYHPYGQILLITDGLGYYQEKGGPTRLIRKGDVIKCPPKIEHWHGASHESAMSHIALGTDNGEGAVVWLRPVTEEEYNKIK